MVSCQTEGSGLRDSDKCETLILDSLTLLGHGDFHKAPSLGFLVRR
jgi:hypothetical protein